jgi:hypothetical protein
MKRLYIIFYNNAIFVKSAQEGETRQRYTYIEIVNLCGLPPGTVKSSMRLGLLALKRELVKGGVQEAAC